jgi:hypothetical protein
MRAPKGLLFAFWTAASQNGCEKGKKAVTKDKYLAHESCKQRLETTGFYDECLAIGSP